MLEQLESLLDGADTPSRRRNFDFSSAPIYAALSGLQLASPLELSDGLILRPAYSYVIKSQVVAFKKPVSPRAPHPAPWSALLDDGIASEVEIVLSHDAKSLGFDRLNTLWFLACLLRLKTGLPVQVPFMSSTPLSELAEVSNSSAMVALETDRSRLFLSSPRMLSTTEARWLANNFEGAALAMRLANVNRAAQATDRAIWHGDVGAGIVMAWAAIETLIRPGDSQITDRVSKGLSVLLSDSQSERDRLFQRIRASYRARGASVHSSEIPENEDFLTAIGFARQAVLRSFEMQEAPDIDRLLDCWRKKVPYS